MAPLDDGRGRSNLPAEAGISPSSGFMFPDQYHGDPSYWSYFGYTMQIRHYACFDPCLTGLCFAR